MTYFSLLAELTSGIAGKVSWRMFFLDGTLLERRRLVGAVVRLGRGVGGLDKGSRGRLVGGSSGHDDGQQAVRRVDKDKR